MKQEEPGQPVVGDQAELLAQPLAGLGHQAGAGVAAVELCAAHAFEHCLGRLAGVGEVGVAVAQIAGEVEAAAVGHLGGPQLSLGREEGGRLGRRAQHRLVVSPPLGLAGIQRGVAPDRYQGVLQERAPQRVGVHVPGACNAHPQGGGELCQEPVSAGIAAPVGPVQLDGEAVLPEHPAKPAGDALGVTQPAASHQPGDGTVARAAREAVQPLGVALDLGERRPRDAAVVVVGGGDQPAQVAIPLLVLGQERQVGAVVQGQLAPGDGPKPRLVGGVGVLERSRQAVVVGQRERLVAERGRPDRHLLRLRCAVQKRVTGVSVEFRVNHD